MDSLNKQERTEAFIKVLAFFLAAIIVVSIPMYYAFKLPEKENTLNQVEYNNLVSKLEEINNFELEFLIKTDSAIALYNAFKDADGELIREKMQLRYSSAINEMEDYIEKTSDDTIKSQLYNNIMYTYNNLFITREEIDDLREQLDECMKTSSAKNAAFIQENRKVIKENEKTIREKEIDLINKVLNKHNGSIKSAAKELGTTERKLKKRMKELGIS